MGSFLFLGGFLDQRPSQFGQILLSKALEKGQRKDALIGALQPSAMEERPQDGGWIGQDDLELRFEVQGGYIVPEISTILLDQAVFAVQQEGDVRPVAVGQIVGMEAMDFDLPHTNWVSSCQTMRGPASDEQGSDGCAFLK